MRWLELTVEADAEAVEAVSEIFGRLGRGSAVRPTRLVADPDDEQALREDPSAPYLVTVHIPDDGNAPDAVQRTEGALGHLQAFDLRPIGELSVRSVEEVDWLEGWRSGYAPQRIGRLLIVPSWLEPPVTGDDVVLRLDPGMAFGTGLHPTTRACLRVLQELAPMPPRVLDVGSGSGILAIAALMLGAVRAHCVDTDPAAVHATRENAERNGVAARLSIEHGSLSEEVSQRYPLVVANLVASVLVALAPRLAAHLVPGGRLVAAGIIGSRQAEVARALEGAGLAVHARCTDDDWVALVAGHRLA